MKLYTLLVFTHGAAAETLWTTAAENFDPIVQPMTKQSPSAEQKKTTNDGAPNYQFFENGYHEPLPSLLFPVSHCLAVNSHLR